MSTCGLSRVTPPRCSALFNGYGLLAAGLQKALEKLRNRSLLYAPMRQPQKFCTLCPNRRSQRPDFFAQHQDHHHETFSHIRACRRGCRSRTEAPAPSCKDFKRIHDPCIRCNIRVREPMPDCPMPVQVPLRGAAVSREVPNLRMRMTRRMREGYSSLEVEERALSRFSRIRMGEASPPACRIWTLADDKI